jgi:protein-S-isoprenylcysteine O-methyltransferase Ste14
MYLLDQRALGIAILILLGMLVIIKQAATGSILERPKGIFLVQLVNIYNLFFLLVVNPLAGILLITRRLTSFDPTHIFIPEAWVKMMLQIGGLVICAAGYFLMAWALMRLGGNYQLGGSAPRAADELVIVGPYRFIRHPMYTAALSISLGLAFLVQSLGFFAVFCIYLYLILTLIPIEEEEMQSAYNDRFSAYRAKVKKLIPCLY